MTLSRRDALKAMSVAAISTAGCSNHQQQRADMADNEFPSFTEQSLFEYEDIRHPVFRDGEGPGILLMHELPGMTPEFWRFAGWVRDAGFTVFVPDLYSDKPGKPTPPSLSGNLLRTCISREIHMFARNSSSPVTKWLRHLAAYIHQECAGPGVGAIGMCMTGNFALSLVLEEAVIAPIASQPAMPVNYWTGKSKPALHMTEEEIAALKERNDIDVMALRFNGDPTCTKARFDAIEALIGKERFKRIELEDSAQNPEGNPYPHAVLTRDLIDEEGSLTLQARDRVIEFLQEKLLA